MSTEFTEVYEVFFDKIQNDADFFLYNNVDTEEALEIAESRSLGYLKESVSKLVLSCTPDIDFTDYDLDVFVTVGTPPVTTLSVPAHFNETLTYTEIDILANIMYEMYFDKDMVKLKALANNLSPKDMNVFSPANERRTFIDMVKFLKNENKKMIKAYASRERLTGALKQINYASYDEEE